MAWETLIVCDNLPPPPTYLCYTGLHLSLQPTDPPLPPSSPRLYAELNPSMRADVPAAAAPRAKGAEPALAPPGEVRLRTSVRIGRRTPTVPQKRHLRRGLRQIWGKGGGERWRGTRQDVFGVRPPAVSQRRRTTEEK